MVKHRRYPTKKLRKTKMFSATDVDDFEDYIMRDDNQKINKSKNNAPWPKKTKACSIDGNDDIDDQPLSWRARELQQLSAMAKENSGRDKNKYRRVRKPNSSVLAQALKLGYEQRPWEDADRLIGRINRDSNHAINEEMLKAQFGQAGRDVKDIAEEYKELDKKAAEKKNRKRQSGTASNTKVVRTKQRKSDFS